MDSQPAAKSSKGLFVNPRIWQGPATVVSDHLKKHGVAISVIGVTPSPGQTVMLTNVLKRP
jgi:hypothetical protein